MDGDEPVGFKVSLLPPPPEGVSSVQPAPYEVVFKTKVEADTYKREKQAAGWVACVTPVFLAPQISGKMRKKHQVRCAPPGFSKDWRLRGEKS